MDKMWAGRFSKQLDDGVNDFNSSISFDCRMFAEDIAGSMAHAKMLCACGIITVSDLNSIIGGLQAILDDLKCGKLEFDLNAEDIHMFVESVLTTRIGDAGKKLHTARSRNDQVAVDVKLYLLKKSKNITSWLVKLLEVVCQKADENTGTIMPGYTHLQRAQPITLAHHLLAYAEMFKRDISRLDDWYKRTNISPLGSCALAGTTHPIDRDMTANLLGFDSATLNSIDGVSDRDFVIELASIISLIMMHLSRFSEEIILWSSLEFKFIELDDAYSTGSSIMPQKKNPDVAELVRGKTGRTYGNLMALFTMMKGLPLAYNKDMQEDKEAIFDSIDTVELCLSTFAPMLGTAKVLESNMKQSAQSGFINATDCADYLAKKGMPFRSAYKIAGELVAFLIEKKLTFETLSLKDYKMFSDLFEDDIFDAIDMQTCINKRTSKGGPAEKEVEKQLCALKAYIDSKNCSTEEQKL